MIEEVLRHQRCVAALVLLVVVGDPTAVVVITQDHGQAVGGDSAILRESRIARHPEASVVQFLGHLFHSALARGVQLEAQEDERCSYRIDADSADPTPIDYLDGVQVANGGAGDRAAVLSFLPHFVLDVFGALA
ncbi:hypothetical protein OG324_09005 [Streptomyces sp. NBC_01236]|nr:hypothetical protein OG324_09005 [Streptomyces sp. NBC_01236]